MGPKEIVAGERPVPLRSVVERLRAAMGAVRPGRLVGTLAQVMP